MRDYLNYLSIQVIQSAGDNQLLCVCPFCEKKKFYINTSTGLYKCQAGSCQKKGNPWILVKELQQLPAKEIRALLDRFKLQSGTSSTKEAPEEAPGSSIRLPKGSAVMSDECVKAFCVTYGIEESALRKIMGNLLYRHKTKPHALFQSWKPGQKAPTGIMRAHLEKELIKTKHGFEKYPQIYGSSHGLFGLKRVQADKPDVIYFVEGWRDAIAVTQLGLFALCSSGGACTFKDEWLPAFANKTVYVIMDTDKAGVINAARSTGKLCNVAKKTYNVTLPYEVTKDHGHDVYDFIGEMPEGCNKTDEFQDYAKKNNTLIERTVEPGEVELENDEPDVVADAFIEFEDDRYAWNEVDLWSRYRDNQWHHMKEEIVVQNIIRRFILNVKVHRMVGKGKDRHDEICSPGAKMKGISNIKNYAAWLKTKVEVSHSAPYSLDGKIDIETSFAMKNGILDVSTKEPKLIDHNSDYYTFNYLPYDYDPDALAEVWLKSLGQYFRNADGTPDLIAQDIIHQWIFRYLVGYTSGQKILNILGAKRTGKGTIARTIRKVVGSRNCTALTIASLNAKFGLQPCLGKRLGIFWDASFNAGAETTKAVEMLKMISGEDGFNVDVKFRPQVEVESLGMNILMLANEMIKFNDTAGVLASRMTYLRTTKSFYGHEDPDIEGVIAKELPGILNLAIKAPRALIEHPDSQEMQEEQAELGSPILAFLKDQCDLKPWDPDDMKENLFIPKKLLLEYYRQWSRRDNHRNIALRTFIKNLRAACPEIYWDYRPHLDYMKQGQLAEHYAIDKLAECIDFGPAEEARTEFVGPRPHCLGGIDIAGELAQTWRNR